jgi:hypothetical protein
MNRLALLSLAAALCACKVPPTTDVCSPNPCTQENRNVCVAEAGEARCLCNEGHLPRPNGACEAVGAGNCPEHGGDVSEPDDCLAKANAVTLGVTQNLTIDPPGDYDFFGFDGAEKTVYSASAQAQGTLYPRIDVFDANGTWLGADERAGTARLAFRTRGSGSYYFRVSHSPVDPSVGVGAYAVTLQSLGAEDHGDSATEASPIGVFGPGSTVTSTGGTFLYPDDQDWFSFDADTTHTYRLTFDVTQTVPRVAVFFSGKLDTPLFTAQGASFDFGFPPQNLGGANSGRVYLVLYAPRTLGNYSFSVTSN